MGELMVVIGEEEIRLLSQNREMNEDNDFLQGIVERVKDGVQYVNPTFEK